MLGLKQIYADYVFIYIDIDLAVLRIDLKSMFKYIIIEVIIYLGIALLFLKRGKRSVFCDEINLCV